MSDENKARLPGWVAVARSKNLRKKPLRILIEGQAYALFRNDEGVHCIVDRCPHRSAPLSGGRVVDGEIECPYHGWRFNGQGSLTAIPCHLGEVPRVFIPVLQTREAGGLIFVARKPSVQEPYVSTLAGEDTVSIILENRVRSRLADVMENILDATHTHFTHKGVLRGLSTRRYHVKVTLTGGDGWVEALYQGEPHQEGVVSRLLEGDRDKSVARFLAPGIAELEFWGKKKLNLVTTFHLRQESDEMVSGFGILAGYRQHGLGYLKAALLRPLFMMALRQDKQILEASADNRKQFGDIKHTIGPVDLLRSEIDAILRGDLPSVAQKPAEFIIEL